MPIKEEPWYIVKASSEHCELMDAQAFSTLTDESSAQPPLQHWGPFDTKNQAIAKRVGLIRAGKCQPK
ncbi:MAG: DDE transposase family protein [Cyanobacteria bacterium J06634_5]